MKALVTGGAGFIGSHVVRALIDRGIDVRVLLCPGEKTVNIDDLDVERVTGDVLDVGGLAEAIRGCDQVYHLAAIYALWLPDPGLMERVNVEGTRNVLTCSAEAGVSRVVHTSSIAAFGGAGLDADATEESPFHLESTGNLYARTKYDSHKIAEEFAASGLDVRIACPCAPFGPGDLGPTPTGRLLLSLLNLPAAFILRSANNLVDVRDVAEGHVLAAEKGRTGESYLLGNENCSHEDLAEIVYSITGVKKKLLAFPVPLLSTLSRAMVLWSEHVSRKPPLLTPDTVRIAELGLRADCSKAFTELGLPRRPLAESVRDALVWFADHGYITDNRAKQNLMNIAHD